jgi:hypothetical protein
MEPTKPKLPGGAIELYNLFIHGEIGRRDFMDGVQRFAIGGLTAATLIEALMPNCAAAKIGRPTFQVCRNSETALYLRRRRSRLQLRCNAGTL